MIEFLPIMAINGGLCEVEQTVYEKIMEGRFDEIRLVDPTIYNELRKTFYIVSDDFDELSFVKYQTWKSKFKNDVFAITIAPTMDCNFKCFYCYQQDYKQPEYMSKETADKVISFIKQLINQNTKVSVAWYGGEPLLAIEVIEYLSKGLKTILFSEENKNKISSKFTSSLVTNGYLLNEKNSKILSEECNIKIVQVTIDGPREINDRRRPHKNGGPVYDIIVKNLKDNAHFFERILVRINVDKTNEWFISDLLEELKSMPNNIHPYLAPLHTDNVSNVTFSGICYDSKDFGLEVENRPELVGLLKYPQPNYGVCGATKENSFCVDPEGYLYKCWNEVGQKEKSISSVESHITNYKKILKVDYI
ncbi:radical SAM protein [Caldisericum sp. AR60]|uniref:radical SAM protein n=1 Tax=Caldisericum sp. AR60 TaxID=3397852 RepID=UPI0039FC199F